MKYPNGDLWCVRQIELLDGALEEMINKTAKYYPRLEYGLNIPGVANYKYKGVLDFSEDDRTIMFEYGDGFGLTEDEIAPYLQKYGIHYEVIHN